MAFYARAVVTRITKTRCSPAALCANNKMNKTQKYFLIIPFVALFCSVIILVEIYPYRPNSILSWAVLYLLSFPIVILFEYIGDKLLGNKYVSKLTSPVRIVYGIVILSIIIFLSIILLYSADPFLTKWGT